MNRFLWLLFIVIGFPFSAVAGEPATGIRHPVGDTGWHWTLSDTPTQQVQLTHRDGSHAVYDISECSFCTGEEDNCQANGIHRVSLPDNEPAVAVVCHKGAHSQRVQVLAPLRDRQSPVFTVTGDYWVYYQPLLPHGFEAAYDRRGEDGTPIVHTAVWPQQAVHE